MVVTDLRTSYHRSVLGFLWTLLNPILMMATLTAGLLAGLARFRRLEAVRGLPVRRPGPLGVVRRKPDGLLAGCIVANEGLIRKIYLPKLVFPLAKVLIEV